jgi:hypothetical protein
VVLACIAVKEADTASSLADANRKLEQLAAQIKELQQGKGEVQDQAGQLQLQVGWRGAAAFAPGVPNPHPASSYLLRRMLPPPSQDVGWLLG